jgi:hypothetical protein
LKASVQLLANERSGAVPDQKHNTVEEQTRNTLLDLQHNTVKDEARLTVQGQLSQICDSLAFDFIMISGVHGEPLAAVLRDTGGFPPSTSFSWSRRSKVLYRPITGFTR